MGVISNEILHERKTYDVPFLFLVGDLFDNNLKRCEFLKINNRRVCYIRVNEGPLNGRQSLSNCSLDQMTF